MSQHKTTPLVTKEKVFAAADKLKSEGVKPTGAAVKEELGGGSFSSIGPLLSEWRITQRELDKEARQSPVPESLNAAVSNMVNQLWRISQNESDKRLQGERKSMAEDIAEQRERENELALALDSIEETNKHLLSNIFELKTRIQSDGVKSAALEADLVRAVAEGSAAAARSEEMERRNNELRIDLDKAHAHREELERDHKEAITALLAHAKVLEAEKEAAVTALKNLETDLYKSTYKAELLDQSLNEAKADSAEKAQLLLNANTALIAAGNEAARLDATATELRQQNEMLTQQLVAINSQLQKTAVKGGK